TDGRAHTPNSVSAKTNRFLHEIGVPATAHQLRHRFGTDLHALDPDLYRQAKLMGHASMNTTQRYTAVEPIEAARYIEQLTLRRIRPTGAAYRLAS
ncbi:tyrosine-type recombinase/integrase, partial [Pseudonocardia sp. RS010]|uniref:tyrosine-type recombinase/integrase n=1 Tax=Pseudonocardia sp. RS010 TaxID=3385979 RepID=UPI0039A2F2C1